MTNRAQVHRPTLRQLWMTAFRLGERNSRRPERARSGRSRCWANATFAAPDMKKLKATGGEPTGRLPISWSMMLRKVNHQAARSLVRRKVHPWDAPGLVRMNLFEAKITNPIDINTIAGGHFRLMPGQYRVTPDRQGGAELVRIDAKQPTSPIRLTPVQWGILEGKSVQLKSPFHGENRGSSPYGAPIITRA